MSDEPEKRRLMAYFAHRPYTMINILKDCFKARKGGVKNFRQLPLPDE